MSTLNESVARRIAALFCLMLSDFKGESDNASVIMKKLLKSEGLTPQDIATVIENANGEIEERKYSDSDAEIIFTRGFTRGVEKGRAEQARMQEAPPEFYDADGRPRWNEIALCCQQKSQRLRPAEQGFIDDMAGRTLWREPSEKQGRWLLSIFLRLGGRRS